jgi:hypothetical protein
MTQTVDAHYYIDKSCLHKANLSEDEANAVVDTEARNNRVIYYYKCQLCGSYHLTHVEPFQNNKLNII